MLIVAVSPSDLLELLGNELLKVAQSFMPRHVADGQFVTRLSAGVALFVLLCTMPINVYAPLRGIYLILYGIHSPLPLWMLVAHVFSYLACAAFVVLVQTTYIRPLARRVFGLKRPLPPRKKL